MGDCCMEIGRLGFQMSPCHSLSRMPWASPLTSWNLGFVIHKMGMMIPVPATSQGCGED